MFVWYGFGKKCTYMCIDNGVENKGFDQALVTLGGLLGCGELRRRRVCPSFLEFETVAPASFVECNQAWWKKVGLSLGSLS
jgi:hypothetical protein